MIIIKLAVKYKIIIIIRRRRTTTTKKSEKEERTPFDLNTDSI